MRIALLFTFFLWCSSCLATATHHSHFARRDSRPRSQPSFDALTIRQHRIRRDLLDVCINVDINLLADASKLLGQAGSTLGSLGLASDVQLCLCLKDLDIYLDTNIQIQPLVELLGKNTVDTLITALINTSPDAQQCNFPLNSHHVCSNSNPCHYECDNPYTLQGGACVCDAPYMSCNGVCGLFSNGCGSAVPRLAPVRAQPALNLAQARRNCKAHESVCGVPGREGTLQFECLDTNSTATSCGGCATPHPFRASDDTAFKQQGVDCTAIPRVQHVGCTDRRCVIHSCRSGWTPNLSGTGCMLDPRLSLKRRKINQDSDKNSEGPDQPACDASPITPDLQSQLAGLADLVIDLQGLGALLGGPIGSPGSTELPPYPAPSSGISTAPDTTSILGPNLIPVIVQTTGNVLSSPTISSLLSSIGDLLDLGRTAQGLLLQCGCLHDALGLIEQILGSLMSIQHLCDTNPIALLAGTPSITLNGHSPTSLSSPFQSVVPHLPLNPPLPPSSSQVDSSPPLPTSSPFAASGGPEDIPIVVGLTDTWNGLGLGSGPLSLTVEGLDNSINIPVNNILDGFGIGPLNARQDALSAAVDANINSDLVSLLQGVAGLVNNLLLSLGGGVLSATTLNSALVSDVVASVGETLASPSVSLLLGNVNGLVASTGALAHGVDACGCASGLGSALTYILALAKAALELQSWCWSNPITSVSSIGPGLSIVTFAPDTSSVTSAAAYTTTHSISNPHSIAHHSPTLTQPHSSTAHTSLPSPTCIDAGSLGTSGDLPIIVGLDHLLARLGLAGSTGIVVVDGLGPVSNGVNKLLNGVGIGPHDIRRSKDDSVHSVKEYPSLDPNVTVAASPYLLVEVNALVDLILGLNAAGVALPSAPTPDLGSSPTSGIPPAIDFGIVEGLVSAAIQLVSSATISDLSDAADALYATSLGYLQSLDACRCIQQMHLESFYNYLVQIVETSLALQNMCHAETLTGGSTTDSATSPVPSAISTSNPGIIAGLIKLLTGLGVHVPVSSVADGLLGGNLDNPADLLDSFGVGLHGVRMRSTL